jgi:xanthine phosphoribosyltransferase
MVKYTLLVSILLIHGNVKASHELSASNEVETAMVHKRSLSLQAVQSMCKNLYTQIIERTESPFKPELIIGLSRGGLIPLCFLAGEGMFNNRHVKIISITSYNDQGTHGKLTLLAPWGKEDFAYLKKFKSILIVDDLVDSGATIAFVVKMLQAGAPHAIIKTAALFYKKCSVVKPNYYVEETTDWIVFPWEYTDLSAC